MIKFLLFKQFNNYHERIKFTIEEMNNNKLKFLDLDIIRLNNTIILDWSQKIISSGRTLSFLSNHPFHQKVGVLYGLIDRAILLSHPMFHNKNIVRCINIFLDNEFPLM